MVESARSILLLVIELSGPSRQPPNHNKEQHMGGGGGSGGRKLSGMYVSLWLCGFVCLYMCGAGANKVGGTLS